MSRTNLIASCVAALSLLCWPWLGPAAHAAEGPFGSPVEIPLNGDGGTTPPLVQGGPGAELEVSGTFFFDYDGKEYDAFYTTDSAGRWGQPHDFFSWPDGIAPVNRAFDGAGNRGPSGGIEPGRGIEPANQPYDGGHTYRFRVGPGYDFTGKGVTFRLDIDEFVDQFVIPPSQVRALLRPGAVPLTVRPVQGPVPAAGAPAPSLLSRLAAPVGVGLLLVLGAAAWRYQRMQQKQGLDADLRDLLKRLRQKHERLLAALDQQQADYTSLRQRFMRLMEGAQALAGHVQTFRRMERQVDRPGLAREIDDLEHRLAQADDAAQRRDLEAALAEKRKVLAMLEQTTRNQDRYLARLSKVEAIIDSSQLKVMNLQVAAQDTVLEDRLIGDVDEELEILEETVEEVQRMWPGMDAAEVRLSL